MNKLLTTIIGLCEQADREPEKEAQILAMIPRVIKAEQTIRKPSPKFVARAKAENERAHRNRRLAAEAMTRHRA